MRGRCGVAIHSLFGENSVLARHSVGGVLQRGWRYLTDGDYRWRIEAAHGRYDAMPDEEYLRLKWRHTMGYELDLEHPRTFNEKLQWLKLHDRRPLYTQLVDKYRVREYVAQKIGAEHLIPSLGVWDDPDEIDFAALPQQFVLKCNHNSGLGLCVCTDKSQLDIAQVKANLRRGLAENYYLQGREWPYRDVPRKIVGEQFMVDESGTELKDYRIFNFDGKPRFIMVDFDKSAGPKSNAYSNIYTPDWQFIKMSMKDPYDESRQIDKPACLDELIEAARLLSAGLPQARTDLYVINGQIYFGEITLFHNAGFTKFRTYGLDEKLGSWITLPVMSTGGAQCDATIALIRSSAAYWHASVCALADGADAQEAA